MVDARRDESATPDMETRTFTDEEGRRWAGSIMSGRFAGGESHAEVIFVCEDVPSAEKRYTRLDVSPTQAAEDWRRMGEEEMRQLFRDSDVA